MKELKEDEIWLKSAKWILNSDIAEREKYTVIAAQSIHSIIRANDALTLKFISKRAVRHDDAQRLFLDLVRLNKIPSKFADLKRIIISAVQTKSKADYKGIEVSRKEAERWIRNAEKFLSGSKECLTFQ